MTEFVVASHNKKKLKELMTILSPLGFRVLGPDDVGGLTEAEENGATFEENALIKARSACAETGMIAVADDSGLCVDMLFGAPGIYSARYAGTGRDEDNNALLLRKLSGIPKERRTARFVSCIACVFPDGREFTVRGEIEGLILEKPEGNGGFGYDPLFMTEYGCFGSIPQEEKDRISHRARSIAAFEKKIKDYI